MCAERQTRGLRMEQKELPQKFPRRNTETARAWETMASEMVRETRVSEAAGLR